jgi:hypothetical protein
MVGTRLLSVAVSHESSASCCLLKLVFFDAISGFTETNYTQLTELYQKYREKGQLPLLVYVGYRLDYAQVSSRRCIVPMSVKIIGCDFSGRSEVELVDATEE